MTKPLFAWSHTALTSFETCPRRYQLTKVLKQYVEPVSVEMNYGKMVHKSLENYVAHGTPMPKEHVQFQNIGRAIRATEGDITVEQQVALTQDFRPVGFFDREVWMRCVYDVKIKRDNTLIILDYKTGKRKFDADQLKLFAATGMHLHPDVDKVSTGYIWLKENKTDKQNFTRDDLPSIWNDFLPRVERVEIAYRSGNFPAKPSGLCRNYCPCKSCEFCGK